MDILLCLFFGKYIYLQTLLDSFQKEFQHFATKDGNGFRDSIIQHMFDQDEFSNHMPSQCDNDNLRDSLFDDIRGSGFAGDDAHDERFVDEDYR